MAMAGLTIAVDKDDMVFVTNAEGTRDRRYIVRLVAENNGDAEHNAKRVVEGLPHEMALPFSLPQIGGFAFGQNSSKMAHIMRLPWGAARSKTVAYVRGAYLISNHHNGQRLAAFTRTVLAPTIQYR